MRRALLPILAAVALAVTAVAAPAAKAPAKKARAKAVAMVVQVIRPGADPVALGSLRTRTGPATGGGDFAFGDGAAVRVTGSTTVVEAQHRAPRRRRTRPSPRVPCRCSTVSSRAASLRVAAGAEAKTRQRQVDASAPGCPGSASRGVAVNAATNDVSTCRASAR